MKAAKWTKEESVLVLDLYFKKPVGIKEKDSPLILDLAQTIGRTPNAVYRRMYGLLRWYPAIPLLFHDDLDEEDDPFQPFLNEYFINRKKLHKDAALFLSNIRIYTLTLHLYFHLVPSTMVPKVPEVASLAKLVGRKQDFIVEILRNYLSCDPFMQGKVPIPTTTLQRPCRLMWERYGKDANKLNAAAQYITEYYTNRKHPTT